MEKKMLDKCTAVHMASDKEWIARCREIALQAGFARTHPFLGVDDLAERAGESPVQFLFAHYGLEGAVLRETVAAIRHHKSDAVRFMPLIVFTRDSSGPALKRFLTMGFDDIVSFPCNISYLVSRLLQQLGHRLDYYEVGDYFGPDRRRLLEGEEGDGERRAGGAYTHIVIERDPEKGVAILSRERHDSPVAG